MFSKKQLAPPTQRQLDYIKVLENKSGMRFYGTTTREAIKYIELAKRRIVDNQIIANKLRREKERGYK